MSCVIVDINDVLSNSIDCNTSCWRIRGRQKTKFVENQTRYLLPFDKCTMCELTQLEKITSNVRIMRNVGKGVPWTLEHIINLMNKKYQYHWVVMSKDTTPSRVVGYVGLHQSCYQGELQIRVFVDPQGQGHGKAAVNLAVTEYYGKIKGSSDIRALVSSDNLQSIKLFKSIKEWKPTSDIYVYGKMHKSFLITSNN